MSKQLLQPGEYGHASPYVEEEGESQLIYRIGCDACSTVIHQPGNGDIAQLQDRFKKRACFAIREDVLYMSIF